MRNLSPFHLALAAASRVRLFTETCESPGKRLLNSQDAVWQEEGKELQKLLVKADGESLLLETNHDPSHIFANYLKAGTVIGAAKTHSDKRLIDAIGDCEQFAGGEADHGRLGRRLASDAARTRRVKVAGDHWVVAEKKGRQIFTRGVWAPAATIECIRADLDAERSTESFTKKKEADARRQEKAQAA
jgi:hypothetical protein